MKIPPNMKRRVVAQPVSAFTELSLSDEEMSQLCVIPSRAAAVPVSVPVLRRARRSSTGRMAMAAGMAFLALPSCTSPVLVEATVETVQLVRAAAAVHKRIVVSAIQVEATSAQGRTVRAAVRPAAMPPVVESALLIRASRAMEAGQFRAALAMYQKLIRRQPAQVDALFGAALASHELRQLKGSSTYLNRTLALNPDHPLANVLAGFSDQLGKRFGGARDHYSRFLTVEASGVRADEIRSVLAALPAPGGSAVTGTR